MKKFLTLFFLVAISFSVIACEDGKDGVMGILGLLALLGLMNWLQQLVPMVKCLSQQRILAVLLL